MNLIGLGVTEAEGKAARTPSLIIIKLTLTCSELFLSDSGALPEQTPPPLIDGIGGGDDI
jgi:hypothetical protein